MSEIAKQLGSLKSQIVSVVRGHIERSLGEMKASIAALDDRISGIPDMAAVQVLVDAAVKSAVAAIPKAIDGEDGRDGRDAIELQIEPELDSTKRYPRGTWARHAGGLVRAVCDTRPLDNCDLERAGWEVVVDGVKAIQIEQSGERGFRVVAERTSGQKSSLDCAMPVLLDRGRYSDEKSYEPGDVVDWSGSMWIAQEASNGIEPRPEVKAWRLSVRRGRDGKDGVVRTVDPPKPIKV